MLQLGVRLITFFNWHFIICHLGNLINPPQTFMSLMEGATPCQHGRDCVIEVPVGPPVKSDDCHGCSCWCHC